METDPYSFGALVSQGADIYTFLIATSLQELSGQLAEFVNRVEKFYFQEAAAVKHSLIVILDSEKTESFLLAVPVATDALKASGAVVECMGQDSDLGFG